MSDIADKFWQAPPVTRTLVAAMVVVSALVYSSLVSPYWVIYHRSYILKFPPQLWRLLTPFLLTRRGFNFLFDLYTAWTYGCGLEVESPRFTEPGSYFVFVCFVSTLILLGAGVFMGAMIFTAPLLLAQVYIFALDNKGKKASFFIMKVPMELLPWALLAFSFVMEGPDHALQQFIGILAAHLYDFMTRLYPAFQGGTNYIRTPRAIWRAFGGGQTRSTHKAYGTSFRAGQSAQQAPQNSGWTSGFSNSWGGRGAGRRLGGD